MKVTDYIAEFLHRNKVDCVFGYQGSSIAHLIDSIESHSSLEFIETRHEQGAAFAANGYALSKKRLGVALACSGPGAINLLGGIANAYYDSIPCLFFTGQVSQKEMKTDPELRQSGFQETDIVSIVKPITKYAVTIANCEDIPRELSKAIKIAQEGRRGPVVIDLPHNIQSGELNAEFPQEFFLPSEDKLSEEILQDVAVKMNHSKRPVILLGGGCRNISRETIKDLCALNIPIVVSYRGKDIISNTEFAYCGVIGVYGERYANWAIKSSDMLLSLGARLDGRQTAGETLLLDCDALGIVVDIDEHELANMPLNYLKVQADAEQFLYELLPKIERNISHLKWLNLINSWKKRYSIESEYGILEGVNPNYFLSKLSALADDDAIFTLDVGQNQLWGNTSLCIREGQVLLQSAGLGAMGFSLPAAIGGYCAKKSQTICISGDGGIQMNIQELQTVQKARMPLKIFVFNNSCLGLIRDYQSKALGKRYYGSIEGFGSPNYELLAMAYGFKYEKIENNEVYERIEEILKEPDACFVEIVVSQWSTAYPEPTYQSSIMNQSRVLNDEEKKKVEEELYECM